MAEIKTLKQGETQVLPRTVAEAVNTDSGLSVQAELDALKESTPDVSAQINEHNVAADAHANRFANYLPLSGGTMTGDIDFNNCVKIGTYKIQQDNTTVGIMNKEKSSGIFYKCNNQDQYDSLIEMVVKTMSLGATTTIEISGNTVEISANNVGLLAENCLLNENYTPTEYRSVVNKKYVDDKIAAIPTPDVSAQIEAHNTSDAAHANMHWLTADDEMLSSIDPDGSIDADTLESHPASDFVLKSELSTLVPAPDLTNYYTKAQVDEKITQIQQLIDQAAALVDEINGEVI